jgi:hypothetical protein
MPHLDHHLADEVEDVLIGFPVELDAGDVIDHKRLRGVLDDHGLDSANQGLRKDTRLQAGQRASPTREPRTQPAVSAPGM